MKISFFTVCGGGEDYEFLLGSIKHHAEMGTHLILDTSPSYTVRKWNKLPDTVKWVYEPVYGHGWKTFKLATAIERAIKLCQKNFNPDLFVYLDCDEFFSKNSMEDLFPRCKNGLYAAITHHWDRGGKIHPITPLEWHNRMWTKDARVRVARNEAWLVHPDYNGNPEHHPIVVASPGTKYEEIPGYFHHHVHYAIGSKCFGGEASRAPEGGYNDGTLLDKDAPWPLPLRQWRENGTLPSTAFL